MGTSGAECEPRDQGRGSIHDVIKCLRAVINNLDRFAPVTGRREQDAGHT